MKKQTKRILSVCLSIVISVAMIFSSAMLSSASAETDNNSAEDNQELHEKVSINEITNDGGNPEEISGAASALGEKKQWFEYIPYSPQPVSTVRINDDHRLLFYDPYEYSSAMVMEVTGSESEWSSANSITVSYTTSNSISDAMSSSSNSGTSVQVQNGRDESYSHSSGTSTSVTKSWSDSTGSSDTNTYTHTDTYSFDAKFETSIKVKTPVSEVGFGGSVGSSWGDNDSNTTSHVDNSSHTDGGSDVSGTSDSVTDGWSTVADRITTSTGATKSTSKTWSTNDSKTVTRTFNAAYFNESGSPLQWKIVEYSVYMPMKYDLQCKIDGDWVTTDSAFCLLRTIQGACRAYLKNTQTYVEDWGTGEPVVWDDFWNGFFSQEQLMNAYNNKLYPES